MLLKKYTQLIGCKKVSLLDFMQVFSDEAECLEFCFLIKFDGENCRKCGRSVTSNYVRVRRLDPNGNMKKAFRCKSCKTHIYPLSDTIFRGSAVNIKHLFNLLFLMSSPKISTSAIEACGYIDATYKTVHGLMMKIRDAMAEIHSAKMKGIVEIDEAFLGKGSKVYNWSSISTRKQPIIGMRERESGHVRLFLTDNRRATTLVNLAINNIEYGSTVYTDSWRGYKSLCQYYKHETVDHSKKEFVRGKVHTNSIETFWGTFKRAVRRSHIQITAEYVQQYANETCWRYNRKDKTQIQLFDDLLRRVLTGGGTNRVANSKIKLLERTHVPSINIPNDLTAIKL